MQKTFAAVLLTAGLIGSALAQAPAPPAPAAPPAPPQFPDMTFFITSAPGPNGANLGGLEGADAHCQSLAAKAGAGGKTWRAYLSQQALDGKPAINASPSRSVCNSVIPRVSGSAWLCSVQASRKV